MSSGSLTHSFNDTHTSFLTQTIFRHALQAEVQIRNGEGGVSVLKLPSLDESDGYEIGTVVLSRASVSFPFDDAIEPRRARVLTGLIEPHRSAPTRRSGGPAHRRRTETLSCFVVDVVRAIVCRVEGERKE